MESFQKFTLGVFISNWNDSNFSSEMVNTYANK